MIVQRVLTYAILSFHLQTQTGTKLHFSLHTVANERTLIEQRFIALGVIIQFFFQNGRTIVYYSIVISHLTDIERHSHLGRLVGCQTKRNIARDSLNGIILRLHKNAEHVVHSQQHV